MHFWWHATRSLLQNVCNKLSPELPNPVFNPIYSPYECFSICLSLYLVLQEVDKKVSILPPKFFHEWMEWIPHQVMGFLSIGGREFSARVWGAKQYRLQGQRTNHRGIDDVSFSGDVSQFCSVLSPLEHRDRLPLSRPSALPSLTQPLTLLLRSPAGLQLGAQQQFSPCNICLSLPPH